MRFSNEHDEPPPSSDDDFEDENCEISYETIPERNETPSITPMSIKCLLNYDPGTSYGSRKVDIICLVAKVKSAERVSDSKTEYEIEDDTGSTTVYTVSCKSNAKGIKTDEYHKILGKLIDNKDFIIVKMYPVNNYYEVSKFRLELEIFLKFIEKQKLEQDAAELYLKEAQDMEDLEHKQKEQDVGDLDHGQEEPDVGDLDNGQDEPDVDDLDNGQEEPDVGDLVNSQEEPDVGDLDNSQEEPDVSDLDNGQDESDVDAQDFADFESRQEEQYFADYVRRQEEQYYADLMRREEEQYFNDLMNAQKEQDFDDLTDKSDDEVSNPYYIDPYANHGLDVYQTDVLKYIIRNDRIKTITRDDIKSNLTSFEESKIDDTLAFLVDGGYIYTTTDDNIFKPT